MDINSKNIKGRPALSWAGFFLGWNAIFIFLITGIYLQFPDTYAGQKLLSLTDGNYQDSESFILQISEDFLAVLQQSSFSETSAEETGNTLSFSQSTVTDSSDEIFFSVSFQDPNLISYLDSENNNILYYSINKESGKSYTNASEEQIQELTGDLRPEGFSYRLYWNGSELNIDKEGLPASSNSYFYQEYFLPYNDLAEIFPDLHAIEVWIATADEPSFSPHFYSDQTAYYHSIYFTQSQFQIAQILFSVFVTVLILFLFLFFYYLLRRKAKQQASQKIAHLFGKVWIEFKILLLAVLIILICIALSGPFWAFSFLPVFWIIFFTALDFRYNGLKIFSCNCVSFFLARWKKISLTKPFQQTVTHRFRILCVLEGALLAISFSPFAIVSIPLMIVLALRYYHFLRQISSDMGNLMDRIEEIKSGKMEISVPMPVNPEIHRAAMDLDRIQDGISSAVEERVRSERMKIELITNVSHDIKTPLTSIIGYVDLLRQEPNLPDHVKDYVAILSRKSERLKNMVQDIFDVSKAASGNIDLELSTIDLGKLIRQTLADMEENIVDSGLIFRVKIPDEPVFIHTDGNRMYRVFQNLIKNALQYSLEGSRVFVQIRQENGYAITEIKNTSRYEIDFDSEEITERFVRGDASRSTEGSGLGLSIVKTFTNACGGEFSISTNADLFCARIDFPLAPPPQPEEFLLSESESLSSSDTQNSM